MLFFFRKPKLEVRCVISEKFSHVYEYAKPQHAHKYYPEWWRAAPKTKVNWIDTHLTQSIKTCQGIQDHYHQGMIIPMWTDLAISTNGQGGIQNQFSDLITTNDYQDLDLRAGFRPGNINMKIASPWRFVSEKDVYWMMLPVYWDLQEQPNWEVMPGTVEFYYNYSTNVNLLIKEEQSQSLIKHGQPLCHLVPLTERELVIKYDMITEREFDLLANKTRPITFINKYKAIRRVRKELEEQPKCPFNWLRK
jgi:hypothetical protein